jgi:uracil-DNA glycosylase family 4
VPRKRPDKPQQCLEVVNQRKACPLCADLVNPSRCAGGVYDSNEIGAWSRWQGDVNARVMIVGSDWGDARPFEHQQRRCSGPTNRTPCQLLGEAGLHADLSSCGDVHDGSLFFTNAVLCLKQGGLQDVPPPQYFENCSKFLRRQIDIIQPKLVVCLGQIAYGAVLRAYNCPPSKGRYRNAVEGQPVRLPDGGPLVVAVYDCSPNGLRNRKRAEQRRDWQRLRAIVQGSPED